MLPPAPAALLFFLAANPAPGAPAGPDLPGLSWVTIFWGAGLIGAMTLAVLSLHLVQLIRATFGRKPTIDVELGAKADADDVTRMQVDIKGFALTKDLETVKEEQRLRTVGLEKQISESRHQWREEFNAWHIAAKDRDEERAGRLNRLEQQMISVAQHLAAVAKQADLILASVHNLDAKVDRNNERRQPAGRA